jgi:hypothetical protein
LKSPLLRRFLLALALVLGIVALMYLRPEQHPSVATQTESDPQRSPAGKGTSTDPLATHDPMHDACTNLYQVVCRNKGTTRDPTGYVRPDVEGELITLRQYEEIIHDHPDWSSEQVDEALAEQIYTPKNRNRIESAFRWVKHATEKYIDEQPDSVFNAHEKKLLKSRIRHVVLELPPPVTLYADEPDLMTKNDVFYERTADGHIRMRVGGAYFVTSRSWFNMIFTVAHELGHSIDPCEIRSQRWSFPAYDRLTACFLKTKLVAVPKNRYECGPNDQLSEAFADWLGAQITAEALKSFATEFHGPPLLSAVTNSVRDLCEEEGVDDLDEEFHPTPEVRIAKIFGHNPVLREVLGCTNDSNNGAPVEEDCRFDSKIGDSL